MTIKKTIICSQTIYPYFMEYCESIQNNSNIKLLPLKDVENYPYERNNHTYIFCQQIPPRILNDMSIKSILLNTEQATRPNVLKYLKEVSRLGIQIIDYSQENLSSHQLATEKAFLLPYQYDKKEIERFNMTPKSIKYDVAFIGAFTTSSRRQQIIKKLKEARLKVLVLEDIWGPERDSLILECKILLNIHYHDIYEIYESLRCDRWIFTKMLTISESSKNCALLDIFPLVLFEPYEKLAEKTIEVIKNYDFYYSEFLNSWSLMMGRIKNNRDSKLNEFIKNAN